MPDHSLENITSAAYGHVLGAIFVFFSHEKWIQFLTILKTHWLSSMKNTQIHWHWRSEARENIIRPSSSNKDSYSGLAKNMRIFNFYFKQKKFHHDNVHHPTWNVHSNRPKALKLASRIRYRGLQIIKINRLQRIRYFRPRTPRILSKVVRTDGAAWKRSLFPKPVG